MLFLMLKKFDLLTIGIIAGAVWANEAWGSYWSWDPKEKIIKLNSQKQIVFVNLNLI